MGGKVLLQGCNVVKVGQVEVKFGFNNVEVCVGYNVGFFDGDGYGMFYFNRVR